MQIGISKVLFFILGLTLLLGGAHGNADPFIFFGVDDISDSVPSPPKIKPAGDWEMPEKVAKEFNDRLKGNVFTQDFEQTASVPLKKIDFTSKTLNISGLLDKDLQVSKAEDYRSGKQQLVVEGNTSIIFSKPLTAIGFYIIGISHYVEIKIFNNDQCIDTQSLPPVRGSSQSATPSKKICYFGYINIKNPFTKVELNTRPGRSRRYALDNISISVSKEMVLKALVLCPHLEERYGYDWIVKSRYQLDRALGKENVEIRTSVWLKDNIEFPSFWELQKLNLIVLVIPSKYFTDQQKKDLSDYVNEGGNIILIDTVTESEKLIFSITDPCVDCFIGQLLRNQLPPELMDVLYPGQKPPLPSINIEKYYDTNDILKWWLTDTKKNYAITVTKDNQKKLWKLEIYEICFWGDLEKFLPLEAKQPYKNRENPVDRDIVFNTTTPEFVKSIDQGLFKFLQVSSFFNYSCLAKLRDNPKQLAYVKDANTPEIAESQCGRGKLIQINSWLYPGDINYNKLSKSIYCSPYYSKFWDHLVQYLTGQKVPNLAPDPIIPQSDFSFNIAEDNYGYMFRPGGELIVKPHLEKSSLSPYTLKAKIQDTTDSSFCIPLAIKDATDTSSYMIQDATDSSPRIFQLPYLDRGRYSLTCELEKDGVKKMDATDTFAIALPPIEQDEFLFGVYLTPHLGDSDADRIARYLKKIDFTAIFIGGGVSWRGGNYFSYMEDNFHSHMQEAGIYTIPNGYPLFHEVYWKTDFSKDDFCVSNCQKLRDTNRSHLCVPKPNSPGQPFLEWQQFWLEMFGQTMYGRMPLTKGLVIGDEPYIPFSNDNLDSDIIKGFHNLYPEKVSDFSSSKHYAFFNYWLDLMPTYIWLVRSTGQAYNPAWQFDTNISRNSLLGKMFIALMNTASSLGSTVASFRNDDQVYPNISTMWSATDFGRLAKLGFFGGNEYYPDGQGNTDYKGTFADHVFTALSGEAREFRVYCYLEANFEKHGRENEEFTKIAQKLIPAASCIGRTLNHYHRERARVALVYPHTTFAFKYMNALSELEYRTKFYPIFNILSQMLGHVDVLFDQQIQRGDLQNYDVCVLTHAPYVEELTLRHLVNFMQHGGTLLVTTDSGWNDESQSISKSNLYKGIIHSISFNRPLTLEDGVKERVLFGGVNKAAKGVVFGHVNKTQTKTFTIPPDLDDNWPKDVPGIRDADKPHVAEKNKDGVVEDGSQKTLEVLQEIPTCVIVEVNRGEMMILHSISLEGLLDSTEDRYSKVQNELNLRIKKRIAQPTYSFPSKDEIPFTAVSFTPQRGQGRIILVSNFDDLLFSVADFKEPIKLIGKLRDATPDRDPVSLYLKNELSKDFQLQIKTYKDGEALSKGFLDTLIDEFNRLLTKKTLYQQKIFEKVKLSEETQALISSKDPKEFEGKKLLRFNRLLLEDTYPYEITKSHQKTISVKTYGDQVSAKYLIDIFSGEGISIPSSNFRDDLEFSFDVPCDNHWGRAIALLDREPDAIEVITPISESKSVVDNTPLPKVLPNRRNPGGILPKENIDPDYMKYKDYISKYKDKNMPSPPKFMYIVRILGKDSQPIPSTLPFYVEVKDPNNQIRDDLSGVRVAVQGVYAFAMTWPVNARKGKWTITAQWPPLHGELPNGVKRFTASSVLIR